MDGARSAILLPLGQSILQCQPMSKYYNLHDIGDDGGGDIGGDSPLVRVMIMVSTMVMIMMVVSLAGSYFNASQ